MCEDTGKQKFSTPYTLLDLDYDTEDVVDRLKELKVEEHSETKMEENMNKIKQFVSVFLVLY